MNLSLAKFTGEAFMLEQPFKTLRCVVFGNLERPIEVTKRLG